MEPRSNKQVSRAQSPTQTAVPKLKDSCTSCATSKVRCSKDKPACNRCKRRGMICEYDTSKRTGRTPYQSSKAAQRERQAMDAPMNTADEDVLMISMSDVGSISQDNQFLVDTPMLPSPLDFGPESSFTGVDYSNDAWDSMFDSSASTDPDYFGTSFDDFPILNQQTTHSSTAVAPRGQVHTSHQSQSFPSTTNNAASTSRRPNLGQHNASMLNSSAATAAFVSSLDQETADMVLGTLPTVAAPECCLTAALGILLQLNPNASVGCSRPDSSYHCQELRFRQTVNEVVLENQKVADQVSEILACPCSQDGYLLTIISLIVFRLIDTYSAAAQKPATQATETASGLLSSSQAQGVTDFASSLFNESVALRADDGSDKTARTVLNHLHRVQRVLNLLSNRFEGMKLRDHANRSRDGSVSPGAHGEALGSARALSISSGAFDTIEIDVRKRLRIVSFEIIDLVRKA